MNKRIKIALESGATVYAVAFIYRYDEVILKIDNANHVRNTKDYIMLIQMKEKYYEVPLTSFNFIPDEYKSNAVDYKMSHYFTSIYGLTDQVVDHAQTIAIKIIDKDRYREDYKDATLYGNTVFTSTDKKILIEEILKNNNLDNVYNIEIHDKKGFYKTINPKEKLDGEYV